jgi:hypothetical protein
MNSAARSLFLLLTAAILLPLSSGCTPGDLAIQSAFPPVALSGGAYTFTFQAQGGTPPYREWTVGSGELPQGLTLNPNTGVLSGTVPHEERLYLFVVEVRDSAPAPAAARESFGVRVGIPGTPGPLLARARAYQAVYQERHNSDGLTVTADTPDDPNDRYGYTDLGDACFIHGNSSAGAAFWYAVEGTPEALENARLHARGLDLLNRVNGIAGLLSRSYMPADAPMGVNEFRTFWPESEDHVGEGEFAGYFWKGDVSIDQYSGALVGLSLLYDLVPDASVRSVVTRNILEIADYLWQGGLVIYDADGEPTTYGDFRGEYLEGLPLPNGLAAAASLAWFKLAHHVSAEQRYDDIYRQLIQERNYDDLLKNFMWVYLGYATKHYNVYMAFENMYTLTRLEQDPALHATYTTGFRNLLWESSGTALAGRRARVEENPTFTPWYLQATGQRDPDAVSKAVRQLAVFVDPPLRDRYVQNSLNPDIEKNPEQPQDALYPLPANLRVPDMCIWHRSPYHLDGGEDNGRERSGHDFLLPYWMGRYYGIISPDW